MIVKMASLVPDLGLNNRKSLGITKVLCAGWVVWVRLLFHLELTLYLHSYHT